MKLQGCRAHPAWCVGHATPADEASEGHTGPVAVLGSIEDGAVTLSAEVDPAGWAMLTLDVGEWEAHGPTIAEDFDALLELVTRAKAAALLAVVRP